MTFSKLLFKNRFLNLFLCPFVRVFIIWPAVKKMALEGNEQVLEYGVVPCIAKVLAKKLLQGGRLYWANTVITDIERTRNRLRKFPNIDIILHNIDNFILTHNFLDIINIHHVFHKIGQPKRVTLARQFYNSLKPGGKLLIREPVRKKQGLPAGELKQLFREAGFIESKACYSYSLLFQKVFHGIYQKPLS